MSAPPGTMRALSWNCRGLGKPRAVRELAELARSLKPNLIGLIETKIEKGRLDMIRQKLGFKHGLDVDRRGIGGGISLWWTEETEMAEVGVEAAVEGKKEVEVVKGGELLFCGATQWDVVGRKKGVMEGNLVSPTRLRPLIGVDIRFVASGCMSCHCVALDVEGRCYTWGRNEKGQLGQGDLLVRDRPTVVSELSKFKIVAAGSGRSHSVVVTDEGTSFAFGWNKHGQLGTGSARNEVETSPVRCQVTDVHKVACGADFTVWLSSVEGSSIMTAGLPQYGQLGHGTDNEHNTKDSSVKLAYEAQPRPKAIAALSESTITKVACGTNHTVAVDSQGLVYTWGYGGYGRLGHREQKDEWVPRSVDVFQKRNVLPPNAVISAGAANSACTAAGGQLYMWGKIKVSGDDWMYPKPLMDLSGWNIRCMDSGNMHHFVGADNSCISWGHAQHGELGYGPAGQKSSAIPKKVDALENMHVLTVACGLGHSIVVVDRTGAAEKLDKLDVFDGEVTTEEEPSRTAPKNTNKNAATATNTSKDKKRKKAKESSDSEEESNTANSQSDDDDDDDDSQLNGLADKKKQRGGKAGRGKGRGRGRGQGTSAADKTAQENGQPKKGRGRPRKQQ